MISPKVDYPNKLLDNLIVESTIISPNHHGVGVTLLSEVKESFHILRIFQIMLNEVDDTYHILLELEVFSFENRKELDEFMDNLPHISGLDMLLLLNPYHGTEIQ